MLSSEQFNDDPYQNYGIADSRMALDQDFYYNLLRLEQSIQSGQYSLEIVNKTIAHYAKCVEYFDSVNDPVKHYFIEKIQGTLVNQKTIMKLLHTAESGEPVEPQKRRQTQDSFLSIGEGNTSQNYMMSPGNDDYFDQDVFNDSKENTSTHVSKKGMRQGLLKMQQEMRKKKTQLQNSSNPQDLQKQHHVRQRQMQILMEAQKGIHEVEKGDGGSYIETLQDEDTNEVKQVKIKGTKDILKDQENTEKQQEQIVQQEMQDQEVSLQQRLLERRQRLKQKQEMKKQQQETENSMINDLSVFSNEHDMSHRKESVNMEEIHNQSQEKSVDQSSDLQQQQSLSQQNQSCELQRSNNSGVMGGSAIKNVSEILMDQEEGNKMNIIIDELEDEEEDIETHLQKFQSYSKEIQLPLELQKSMKKASNLQDLDEKSLKQLDQFIDEFEFKNKISKSLNTHEIQDLLKSSGFQKDIQEIEKQDNQNLSRFSHNTSNPSSEKKSTGKKNGRNLSCQIVNTQSNNLMNNVFQNILDEKNNNINNSNSNENMDLQKVISEQGQQVEQTESTNENEIINE